MSDPTIQAEMEVFDRLLREAGTPEWLVRVRRHYAETGTVRAEDMRRLIGDPNRRVDAGPDAALTAFSE